MNTGDGIRSYEDIPGWFAPVDKRFFDVLLAAQAEPGVVVELGAYLGRSAVVIGDGLHPDERFVVVDLFGAEDDLADEAKGSANLKENRYSYRTLTRTQFEANYLALHDTLPEVVQGLSTEVTKHVEPRTVRFMHIDASHLYQQVIEDIRNARDLMREDGVVVFDDYRSSHTPGVAAAVWEAVATLGLHPFAITVSKLYASWGNTARYFDIARDFGANDPTLSYSGTQVHGDDLVRFVVLPPKPAKASSAPSELTIARRRIKQLEKQVAVMRPARRPLRKTRAQDIPAPLRPVLATAWRALPPNARAKIRRAKP